ncbi:MAG TPA: nucleotide exchange factor GrpE [Clostridia bacterium]
MSNNNDVKQQGTPEEQNCTAENKCCCDEQDANCNCDTQETAQNADINNQQDTVEMTQEQIEALKAFNEHLQGLNNQIEEAKQLATQEKARADELARRVISLQSDFDNYRRRNADSIKSARTEGNAEVLIEVIKILDIIEQAQKMIKDSTTIDGIKMIYRQIENMLGNFGVQEIEALGMDFDPNIHNAVEKVKQEGVESGKIIEVVNKGYRLGEKILRYSSVKVAE